MKQEYRDIIEKAKEKIQSLQDEQDRIYSDLLKSLGLKDTKITDNEWLWDYVFNDHGDVSEYSEMVKREVFGCQNEEE